MKAMIVDDNEWILTGIASLLKASDMDLELHCFNNAQDSLDFASKHRPEIVIADVEMPACNGLDMCNQLMQEYSPKLIIISGHDRFQYAKQAIELRAVHYVLKPIKQHELLEAVRQVVDMVDSEEQAKAKQFRMMKAQFFLDLAAGRRDSADLAEYLPLIESQIKARTVSLCLLHIENHALLVKMMQHQEPAPSEDFHLLFKEVFDQCPESVSYYEIRRGYYLFMVFGELHRFENWIAVLFGAAKANHCVASAGISEATNDPSKLFELYKQTVQALQKEFTDGSSKIHRYNGDPTDPASQMHDLIRLYDYSTRITDALSSQNSFRCTNEEIDNLFEYIRKSIGSQEDACLFIRELLLLISMQFMHMMESKPSIFHSFHESSLKTSRTLVELKAVFEACIQDLYDTIHNTIQTKSVSIKRIVDNMLQTDCASVSLETVAEKLNIHPTYLSILFKESIGINFKDYVFEFKMKAAMQMLTSTDTPIYSISDKLGYMDAMYFSRIFKKQIGMTPGEFRKLRSS